jgi:hypothetical protein
VRNIRIALAGFVVASCPIERAQSGTTPGGLPGSPGALLAVYRPIETSAVQGSLEIIEERTGLVTYAAISAGPTGSYALTLTDGHCDPIFARAKSRPDFLGWGPPLSEPMTVRFVREPVGIRVALGVRPLGALFGKTVIVERLEGNRRTLSACGQLAARGVREWAENRLENGRERVGEP